MKLLSSRARVAGFILLPVILAMTLIAAIAFLLNRDNGMNAEMVSSEMDQDRARYAAEAGLQAANAVMQSKNCSGPYSSPASPVTNSSFGGASYSAYASPSNGNIVSLISTGSHNATSVTLTRNNVVAYQSIPNIYTLQPNAAAGVDSYINNGGGEVNKNFGTSPDLQMKPNNLYPLLQFDLSAFPASSLPLSATLSLYPNTVGGGPNPVSMYRLSNSWVEGNGLLGVSWNIRYGIVAWTTPGGDYHPVAVASVPDTTHNVWSSFDITDLATAWLLGRYPNYGVRLAVGVTGGSDKYDSSDGNTASTHPKIDFTYLIPCGATGPSGTSLLPTVTLNPVADAMLNEGSPSRNYGITTSLQTMVQNGQERRIAVQFDLSSIAAGTLFQSVRLRYYVSSISGASANSKPIGAYKLTQPWVEGTLNGQSPANGVTWTSRDGNTSWTTSGGTYNATAIAMDTEELSGISPPPSTFSSGWLSWDLTTLAQEWVDGISVNYGVLLDASTISGKDNILFNSREAASNTPQLVITY